MKVLITCVVLLFNALFIKAQMLPKPDHIIVVMLENKGYSSIIGSSNAPYINSLVADSKCALFSESHGITHPSQPNYLHLYSGNNQGVVNDNQPTGTPFSTCNLGYSLISNAYTFIGYSEDLPSVGSTVFTSGNYVKRHCPWAFWIGTGTNQLNANVHQPYSSFPAVSNYTSLPTVSFIIPNLVHDMHNPTLSSATAISNGDTWLSANLPSLVTWVKANNSLLIIHYDEDESLLGQPTANKIPTLFIGAMVQGGTYANKINHFSILRTIEEMYALPKCDSSNFYQPITNCWSLVTNVATLSSTKNISISPIPASHQLNVNFYSDNTDDVMISVMDVSGKIILNKHFQLGKGNLTTEINTIDFIPGLYMLQISGNNINENRKFIVEH